MDVSGGTPRAVAQQPNNCVTPDHWEMRAEFQTPVEVHSKSSDDVNITRQEFQTPAFNEAFCAFDGAFDHAFGFAMYETPPGAVMYREQFASPCEGDSFVETNQKQDAEEEYCTDVNGNTDNDDVAGEQYDVTNEENNTAHSNELERTDGAGNSAFVNTSDNYTDNNETYLNVTQKQMRDQISPELCDNTYQEGDVTKDVARTDNLENDTNGMNIEDYEFEHRDNSNLHEVETDNLGVNAQARVKECEFKHKNDENFHEAENVDQEDDEAQVKWRACEVEHGNIQAAYLPMKSNGSEINSCIIESIDDVHIVQESEETVTNFCPDTCDTDYHMPKKVENHSVISPIKSASSRVLNVLDNCCKDPSDETDCIQQGKCIDFTEHKLLQRNDTHEKSMHTKEIAEAQMLAEVRSSLASAGISQDVIQNELADFLNMEDPYMRTDEPEREKLTKCSPCRELPGCTEDQSAVISHQSPPRKQSRRRKKENIPRRRSMRIARRQSLLSSNSDALEISDVDKKTDESKSHGECQTDKELNNEAYQLTEGDVNFHSGLTEQVQRDVSIGSADHQWRNSNVQLDVAGSVSSPTQHFAMYSGTPERKETTMAIVDHLIDLPVVGSKRRRVAKGRRRSVRKQKVEDQGEKLLNTVEVEEPVRSVGIDNCEKAFLADFADFGLGDDWIPGEMFGTSEVTKASKRKSSRRKSARLSGAPIPFLALAGNSKVKMMPGDSGAHFPENCVNSHLDQESHPLDFKSDIDKGIAAPHKDTGIESISRLESQSPKHDPLPVAAGSKDVNVNSCHTYQTDVLESLGDLPFEQVDAVKPSRRKKKDHGPARRRSLRLAKIPDIEISKENDSSPVDQSGLSEEKGKSNESKSESVVSLPELDLQNTGDIGMTQNVFDSANTFTALKPFQGDTLAVAGSKIQHTTLQREFLKSRSENSFEDNKSVSKDTPVLPRKRASRIMDKENDEPEVSATQTENKTNNEPKTPNEYREVNKKIKQLYMDKGVSGKKQKAINLETIFESPKKKATGTPLKLQGARKIKRAMSFTETPWLGRPGKNKVTKKKKKTRGNQLKTVLSSKKERCWKLDAMLSCLDEISP